MRYYNPDPNLKRCSKCKEWRDKSEFPKSKAEKDGLNRYCKHCKNKNPYGFKLCGKCSITKPFSEFDIDTRKKCGLSTYCHECNEAYKQSLIMKKKDRPDGTRRCATCKQYLPRECYSKDASLKGGLAATCKACVKAYHQANSDHLTELSRQWRVNNLQRFNEYQREYQRKRAKRDGYKYMKIATDKRLWRLKNAPYTFTDDDWQRALDYFNGCCAVCGRQLKDLFGSHTASADHWIPLTKGGGTVALNIVPLCHGVGGCNNSKHDKMPEEWLLTRYSKKETETILRRIQNYFDWVISRGNAA